MNSIEKFLRYHIANSMRSPDFDFKLVFTRKVMKKMCSATSHSDPTSHKEKNENKSEDNDNKKLDLDLIKNILTEPNRETVSEICCFTNFLNFKLMFNFFCVVSKIECRFRR
jgi:hypothetical protein